MCKLYYFVQSMSYTASIMILTAISIERYFAIIHPMRSKQMTTLRMLRAIVLVIWTVAAGCAVPYLIKYDTRDIGTNTFCLPTGNINNRLYVTISFVLWYVIPLVLMIVMYTKISIVLWKTSRPNNLEKNGFKNKKNRPKRKRQHVRWMAFARGKANEIKEHGFKKQGLKPVIYVSGVTTSASSDEAATDDARHGQYVPCVGGDKPFLQAASSGYDSTTEGSVIEEDREQSSEEAADYEDDWPTSNNKKRLEEYQMKQVYTFRNPTYNGACPSCQSPIVVDPNHTEERGKCSCNNKAPTYNAPVTGTRAAAITGRALKNRVASRKTENALMARRRVIRLLIAVIVSFALCVIPYYIRLLWVEWGEPSFSYFEKILLPITFLLYYFNSGLNPILYAFLSDNFRRSLKEVLCCTVDENSRKRSMRTTMSIKTTHSTI